MSKPSAESVTQEKEEVCGDSGDLPVPYLHLPPRWKLISLQEVCSLRMEGVQPAANLHLPYVGLEHIEPGSPYLAQWGVASEVNSTKSRFYQGDILYGKLRPYLDKAAIAEFDGMCSTDILVLRTNEFMTPEYLAYLGT